MQWRLSETPARFVAARTTSALASGSQRLTVAAMIAVQPITISAKETRKLVRAVAFFEPIPVIVRSPRSGCKKMPGAEAPHQHHPPPAAEARYKRLVRPETQEMVVSS